MLAFLTIVPLWHLHAQDDDHIRITQKALMSYRPFKTSAQNVVKRIESLTFGKYTKKLLLLTPLLDGRWRYKYKKFQVKLNTRKEKGSISFVHKF